MLNLHLGNRSLVQLFVLFTTQVCWLFTFLCHEREACIVPYNVLQLCLCQEITSHKTPSEIPPPPGPMKSKTQNKYKCQTISKFLDICRRDIYAITTILRWNLFTKHTIQTVNASSHVWLILHFRALKFVRQLNKIFWTTY